MSELHRRMIRTADSVDICVTTGGSPEGDPIIFLPGWTMSAEVFRRQFDFFLARPNTRVISYDPRGQGKSGKPQSGYDYRRRAQDVALLIDQCETQKPLVVSWSAGVLDHLAYVREFGYEAIRANVFVDGPPRTMIHDKAADWGWYAIDDPFARYFLMGPMTDRAFNDGFALWMLKDPDDKKIKWLSSIASETPAWIASLTNIFSLFADYRTEFSKLAQRNAVLVVVRDDWRDLAAKWLTAHAPKAEFHAFGGHLMFVEEHDRFNRIISDFAERIR